MKIDIGCGVNKAEGYIGLDVDPNSDADMIVDLFHFPYPFDDNSVDEVVSSHFIEHVPHYLPDWKGQDGWWMFFAELYRICKPGAKLTFAHPYAGSDRADWDPTHVRRIEWMTWNYLSAEWRQDATNGHSTTALDYKVENIELLGGPAFIAELPEDEKAFALRHYRNAIEDLRVTLTCMKER